MNINDEEELEIWKKIWKTDKYEASSHQRIRNSNTGYILSQRLKGKKKGKQYLYVKLYTKKHHKEYLVHRLVAMAFHKGYDKKKYVNHKDKNRLNCKPDNLEWVIPKQNIAHRDGHKNYLNY